MKLLQGRDRLREKVRIRDNYTCQKCKKIWQKGGRRFDVHHEDEAMEGKSSKRGIYGYDKNNLDKMITYCHKCHLNLDLVTKKMSKAWYKNKETHLVNLLKARENSHMVRNNKSSCD